MAQEPLTSAPLEPGALEATATMAAFAATAEREVLQSQTLGQHVLPDEAGSLDGRATCVEQTESAATTRKAAAAASERGVMQSRTLGQQLSPSVAAALNVDGGGATEVAKPVRGSAARDRAVGDAKLEEYVLTLSVDP